MRRRILLFGLLGLAGVLGAVSSSSAASPSVWGKAIQVPGTAALNLGGASEVRSLSCPTAGNCAAGGYYEDGSGKLHALVVDETNDTWGNAIEAPGTAGLNLGGLAITLSVSCVSAGNCAAGGLYTDLAGNEQAFVADETNGSWGNAIETPGTVGLNVGGDGRVSSVSCVTVGNCAAGGYYHDISGNREAFVVDETNGSWDNAIETPGTAALNLGGYGEVASVSCATAAGKCTAGGYYTDGSGQAHTQAFVVSETGGSWGNAIEVPGTAALNVWGNADVNSVSCATAGNCTAGGMYRDGAIKNQPFVVDETNGTWGHAIEVPGAGALNGGGYAFVVSVSCTSHGNCAAAGNYNAADNNLQAFVVDETNGTWGNAIQVPGTAALNKGDLGRMESVSCATDGNCAAGGRYRDISGNEQAFVVAETNGSWGNAIETPGTAALNSGSPAYVTSVSCPATGNCGAGGQYTNGSGSQAFVMAAGYSVAYDGNGASGGAAPSDGSSPYLPGETVTALVPGSLTRTGYRFSGWNTAADGSGTSYQPGGTFSMPAANVTLYAQWTIAYAVAYSGNGATGGSVPSDGSSPYTSGTTVTVLGAGSLRRTGFRFSGWNTAALGSGMSYQPGGTFPMPAANVTLYAQWTIAYAVTYNGNGATGGSSPSDGSSPYTVGTTVTVLGAGSLTRTGYNFSGWNTAANGSGTSYQPGVTFPMPAANVTLYARWRETVQCNQKVRIASPGTNLSGVWRSNELGTYYVRQIGSCIYWIGRGTTNVQTQNSDNVNAFSGTISSAGTTITGYWFNVNTGTSSFPNGSLTLHVVNGTHMRTTSAQTGNFFGSASWTQQSSSAATFVSPSSSSAAVANLVWTCDPAATAAPTVNYLPSTIAIPAIARTTARYNVRQIGSCVVFWGRPKVSPVPTTSPKWTDSDVFFGSSTGSGTSEVVNRPWADVPAGTNHLFGQLTLTVTGVHTFKATGTGGWATINFNHTP